MTNSEFIGEDPMELHVREAEVYLNMTDEEIRANAAEFGMTEDDYRLERLERIVRYQSIDEHELTPEQHQRLYGKITP